MGREIEPEDLEIVLGDLSYPAFRPDAAADLREVTVLDGEESHNLGALISGTGSDAYRGPGELADAVREALGDAEE